MKYGSYVLLFMFFLAQSSVEIEQRGNMKVVCYRPPDMVSASTITASVMTNTLKQLPLKSKLTFFDVPWSQLIYNRKISLADEIPAMSGPCFTICDHGEWKNIMPHLKRIGVTHLFVTQTRSNTTLMGIKILPIPFIPDFKHCVEPLSNKDLLYSFIGYESHSFRRALFQVTQKIKKKDVLIQKRVSWGPAAEPVTCERWCKEYCSAIARSRFGLCPRGYYANTIRLLELMHGGAVPVVYANELSLPEGIDWSKCMIRVPESKIGMVDHFVRTIPLAYEQALRTQGIMVMRTIMADPACFIRYYFDRTPIIIKDKAYT